MKFCIRCGKEIPEGCKFCPECGLELKPTYTHNRVERQSYAGRILKCPSCGELLDSLGGVCPSCGYVITGIEANNTAKLLVERLDSIDKEKYQRAQRQQPIQQPRSLMSAIFGTDLKTDTAARDEETELLHEREFEEKKEQRKAELIANYPIPNTKEDLLEMMVLAKSNMLNRDDLSNQIKNAWNTKFEQVFQKAKVIFRGSPEFTYFENLYNDTNNMIRKKKKKKTQPLFIMLVIFLAIAVVIGFIRLGKKNAGMVHAPITNYEEKSYVDIVTLYRQAGFTNVSAEKVPDLVTGWIHKEGEVIEVAINGETDFTKLKFFDPDATVIVRYHGFSRK